MAVTNTGIVLRTITGVNESDLFLDSEATSVATNTGIVERSIVGVHDANFVHPIGDELISNGGFDNGSTDWTLGTGWSVSDGVAIFDYDTSISKIFTSNLNLNLNNSYKLSFEIKNVLSGTPSIFISNSGGSVGYNGNYTNYSEGVHTLTFSPSSNQTSLGFFARYSDFSITNISVKEMLVNRESTTTNTGIVERPITGVNDGGDLLLRCESTSVVNNTGIVERPITGVNESDPMFPDNTISNIVNIAGLISSLLADLEARATTFENREGYTKYIN